MPTFESVVGGGVDDPRTELLFGSYRAATYSAYICTFLTILKHICLILNERNLGQDCLYLYKNKEIYMY